MGLGCSITGETGPCAFWFHDVERSDAVDGVHHQFSRARPDLGLRHAELSRIRRRRGSGPARRLLRPPAQQWRCCASVADSLLPLLTGGTVLIFSACLAAMGIRRFYGQPVSMARHRADHRSELRRHGVLHLRLRQPDDAGPDLFVRPVDAAGADAEAADVAAGRPRSIPAPGSPASSRSSSSASMAFASPSEAASYRRRGLVRPFQRAAVDHDPGADVPVDGVEFRLPADGDRPAAQRGRRPGAAGRSHRRRQPAASAAALDRGMRAVGAQPRAVRAAGDRSRRLQVDQ